MNTYSSNTVKSTAVIEQVMLPTRVIEKPVAIHEEIRKELIEEVQPVINVEKLKTEVHQVTQPLFDKEVKPVLIENRTLDTQVLPEVLVEGRGLRVATEHSTTRFLDSTTVVVEKPALFTEIEKKQIIEEIQPVVYKETVVPHVIQETKPIYQKIVEGPVYSQTTMPAREVENRSTIAEAYVTDQTVVAPLRARMMLPTQVVEKPVAVHEEIRRETIEEVQPVVNVEKLKTEVHQITAPLFDKEVKPVLVERRVLAQEVLPEVMIEGRGVRAVEDRSSTRYLDTTSVLIEKPAIVNEVERTQIIEEVQPVVYKETVVPTVIRETKPIYQKIVEGPVYSHQTLPARSLHDTSYHYPTQTPIVVPAAIPVIVREVEKPIVVEKPVEHHRKETIVDTITTTTTTTAAPVVAPAKHGLFNRHAETTTPSTINSASALNMAPLATSLPQSAPLSQHSHSERVLPSGEKVVEDFTTTTTHSSNVAPTRAL